MNLIRINFANSFSNENVITNIKKFKYFNCMNNIYKNTQTSQNFKNKMQIHKNYI